MNGAVNWPINAKFNGEQGFQIRFVNFGFFFIKLFTNVESFLLNVDFKGVFI